MEERVLCDAFLFVLLFKGIANMRLHILVLKIIPFETAETELCLINTYSDFGKLN